MSMVNVAHLGPMYCSSLAFSPFKIKFFGIAACRQKAHFLVCPHAICFIRQSPHRNCGFPVLPVTLWENPANSGIQGWEAHCCDTTNLNTLT